MAVEVLPEVEPAISHRSTLERLVAEVEAAKRSMKRSANFAKRMREPKS